MHCSGGAACPGSLFSTGTLLRSCDRAFCLAQVHLERSSVPGHSTGAALFLEVMFRGSHVPWGGAAGGQRAVLPRSLQHDCAPFGLDCC